jgi:hypothetical protein
LLAYKDKKGFKYNKNNFFKKKTKKQLNLKYQNQLYIKKPWSKSISTIKYFITNH